MRDDLELHLMFVFILMLIGLPANATVIWIHTRKHSRLAQNKFPLILAVVDLAALLTALPLIPFSFSKDAFNVVTLFQIHFSAWQITNYMSTLLMASIDKLYAIMRPFKYKLKRGLFVRISLVLALVVNPTWAGFMIFTRELDGSVFGVIRKSYGVMVVIMFISTVVIYSVIVMKIVSYQRNMVVKIGVSAPSGQVSEESQSYKATSQVASHQSTDSPRHHVTALTQMIIITVVYVSCFTPMVVILVGLSPGPFTVYGYFINHVINFFIYLAVNKEFRKEFKVLVKKLLRKESSANPDPVSTLQVQPT